MGILSIPFAAALVVTAGMVFGLLFFQNSVRRAEEKALQTVSSTAGRLVSKKLAEVQTSVTESARRIMTLAPERVQRGLLREGVAGRFYCLAFFEEGAPFRSYGECELRFPARAADYLRGLVPGESAVTVRRGGLGETPLIWAAVRIDQKRALAAGFPGRVLDGLLQEAAAGESLFLIDGTGSIIAGKDPRGAGPRGEAGTCDSCFRALVTAARQETEGIIRTDTACGGRLFAFSRVQGADQWSLGVLAENALPPLPAGIWVCFLSVWGLCMCGTGILCGRLYRICRS